VPLSRRLVPRRACVNHHERAVELVRDQRQVLAEAALRIAGTGDANNKKVVALAGFIGDRLRPASGPRGDNLDVPGLLFVGLRFE